MITNIFFNFFLDAKSEAAKEKVNKKIHNILIDMYGLSSVTHINNSSFSVCSENIKWETIVFQLIGFSQNIARQWILTGNIDYECSLWSNHPKIVGVNSISISVDNVNITTLE